MKKSIYRNLFVLIIILFGVAYFNVSSEYEKKEMISQNDTMCVSTLESCRCLGNLFVMESFPEQYDCRGFEMCKNVNTTSCE